MSPSEHDIRVLYDYCETRNITVHPSIRPKHVPGCGLGVYSLEQIGPNEQLVQIPVSQIFTTNSIPESFLSRPAREGTAVHAQLAAFFAFGEKQHLEPYDAWIATWPEFADFPETMPIFWGDSIADSIEKCITDKHDNRDKTDQSLPVAKKQKVSNDFDASHSRDSSSQQSAADHGRIDWAMNLQSLKIVQDQVRSMTEKLASHLHSIHLVRPDLQILGDATKLTKFFHAWCLVNTRCFYYVPSLPSHSKHKGVKAKAPADPNEAMGLCPFMDLFNHAAPATPVALSNAGDQIVQTPCKVSSGVQGFTAVTTSEVSAGTEILFSYGPHTNDTLWSEYGFMLPGSSNSSDSVLLDHVVLQRTTKRQRQVLEHHDYLASYTLFNDGSVCYRTEMVAWLMILDTEKWVKAVEEGLDPADLVEAVELEGEKDSQQRRNGTRSRPALKLIRQHYQVIEGWLNALREQAQGDVSVLESMAHAEVLQAYKTLSIVEATIGDRSAERELSLARRRQGMCVNRCEQITAMAARGVEASISDSFEDR